MSQNLTESQINTNEVVISISPLFASEEDIVRFLCMSETEYGNWLLDRGHYQGQDFLSAPPSSPLPDLPPPPKLERCPVPTADVMDALTAHQDNPTADTLLKYENEVRKQRLELGLIVSKCKGTFTDMPHFMASHLSDKWPRIPCSKNCGYIPSYVKRNLSSLEFTNLQRKLRVGEVCYYHQ